MLQLEASPLRLPTLHSGSSPALPFTRRFNFREIFIILAGSKQVCNFEIGGEAV